MLHALCVFERVDFRRGIEKDIEKQMITPDIYHRID
jgi:hypothetical protein